MAGGWLDTTLGNVMTLQRGFDLPETEREDGPHPVIASTGQVGSHSAAMVRGPGVVIGRSGSLGGGQFIRSDFWPLNTTLWVKDFKGNDVRFCYYLLKSLDLATYDAGSGVPTLNRNHIHPMFVRAPANVQEQRAIAHILGTLDDKIELNRRMNETLEAIARALFMSWFVDATQDGLPKGWHEGTLGDVAENPRRGIQPDTIEPSTPYIGLEHMPRRCIALSEWGHAEELESNKFKFKRGEVLFGKLRPYFHKVGIAPLDGICSTDILVVTPKELEWFGFVLGHVSSVEFVNYTDAGSTGTKMPRTDWQDMARYEVALPPKPLTAAFTERIHPLVERIIANIHESRTLAALRDALLPKLISGELRVNGMERHST